MADCASLRSRSLAATVVAAAGAGDYCAIARLAASGVWQPGDADVAVAALLREDGDGDGAALHDVNCRRGIAAALTGRGWTHGRSRVLRGAAFAASFDRAVAAGAAGGAEARRALRMGAPPWTVVRAALRHAPEWAPALLRDLPAAAWDAARCRDCDVRANVNPKSRNSAEACELALASPRPGAVLLALLDRGPCVHARLVSGSTLRLLRRADEDAASPLEPADAAALARLAEDEGFVASPLAWPFLRLALFRTCHDASFLGAVEVHAHAHPIPGADHGRALELCRLQRAPEWLVARVDALPHGVVGISEGQLRMGMGNYNILRIMSGMGGLTFTS